jgi:hypothetical protein
MSYDGHQNLNRTAPKLTSLSALEMIRRAEGLKILVSPIPKNFSTTTTSITNYEDNKNNEQGNIFLSGEGIISTRTQVSPP